MTHRPDHVRLLSIMDAAKKARVDRSTIHDWIRTGLLVAIPHGRYRMIRSDHLEQLMRDRYGDGGKLRRRNT